MLMMCALSLWSIGALFALSSENLESELAWYTVAFAGQNAVGPFMLMFVIEFIRKKLRFQKLFLRSLWIVPVISLILAITNKFHGLVFADIQITFVENEILAVFASGPVIYVDLIYVYFLVLIGLYWLVRYFLRLGKKGILTAILIIIASFLVMLMHLIFIFSPTLQIDVTPHFFSFLSLVLFWAISQEQLFTIKPIAYKTLLDSMPDGVLVLNNDNQIIIANPSAVDLLKIESSEIFGESLKDIAPYLCNDDPDCLRHKISQIIEIKMPDPENRTIKLHMQPIVKSNQKIVGKILDLHDITELKEVEEELNKKYTFTETLVNTTSEINTTLQLEDVLDKILESAFKVVPYDAADIVLVDEDGKYKFANTKCFNELYSNDFLLGLDPMSEALFGFDKMVETGRAIVLSETKDNPNWNPILEGTNWIRSYLGAPIRHQEKVIGFINLSMRKPNAFTEENARQVQVFANYAASAISNAYLFRDMSRIAQEMATLNKISQAINSGIRLEEIIQSIFQQLAMLFPVNEFGVTLYNPDTQMVDAFLYRADGSRINKPLFKLSETRSMTRCVIENQGTTYFPDVTEEKIAITDWIYDFTSHSLLGAPLIWRGEIFGVLIAGSEQFDAYSPAQIELVESIAFQSSASINNAKLYEEVQKSSVTDSLTNLDNRRHFDQLINKEIDRAIRYDHDLCLIMLDIDHFKNVNDHYGHIIGDLILKYIADIVEGCLRKTDIAFRYGGEEFVILLPETGLKSASFVAERIRKRIAQQPFNTPQGSIYVTVSLGVCEYETKFINSEEFVNAVDHALYEAKSSGRNQVCLYQN